MKVVGYVRVSTREQEEGYSLDAQVELVEEFCRKREHDLVRIFSDVDSGGKEDRKGFQDMLTFLRKRPTIEGIVAWRLDRLTRNFRSYVELDDLKRRLLFVVEEYADNASGRLLVAIQVSLAKHFLEALAENTAMGMERKAREGHYPSTAPIGYLNRDGIIVPDPLRAPVIRELFEEFAAGNHTLYSITDWARERGLRQTRSGKPLSRSRVHRVLQNPIYYGDFDWKGVRYKGKHENLVSKALWDEVQEWLAVKEKRRRRVHNFALRGLVHCAHCGCMYTAEIQKGKYIYYRCTKNRGPCEARPIREERLLETLGEVIRGLQLDEEVVEWLRAVLEESQGDRKLYVQERTLRLQGRYQTLQRALDCAYEDRITGVLDAETYQRKSSTWRSEMASIEEEQEKLRGATESYYEEGLQLLELAQVAYSLYLEHSVQKKAEMLRVVGLNYSFDGVTVTPTYRKPFDILAEGLSTKDGPPQRDSNPCRRRERAVS